MDCFLANPLTIWGAKTAPLWIVLSANALIDPRIQHAAQRAYQGQRAQANNESESRLAKLIEKQCMAGGQRAPEGGQHNRSYEHEHTSQGATA